jgi:hypothetical protein
MKERDIIKKMVNTIKEEQTKAINSKLPDLPVCESVEKDNFLTRAKILMEEAEGANKSSEAFPISKTTPQFGDVRVSIEDALKKTVGEQVKLEDDALKFYPDTEDLVLNGVIPTLNLTFQFRYQDPSGEGIYVWTDALQFSESNSRTLGKLRNAFLNYKNSIVNDGDLIQKLKKVTSGE